jgi:tripartite-type tricarboxylate transporter receptor subunit TctC
MIAYQSIHKTLLWPVACMCALLLFCGTEAATGQSYPVRPIRMLIQFSPGGAPDLIARTLGSKLTESWGQAVIVDSRPGAGGNLAVEIAARSPPDGYTLIVVSPTIVINPSLYRGLSWDPIRDFVPLALAGTLPNMLMVHPSVPARTVKELIALAKARPGQLNYSTSGVGTSVHLAAELFKSMSGTNIVHVPYKGGSQAMMAVISGEVPLTFGSASALTQVRAGKLIAVAMTTRKRWAGLPQVPTIAESGLPGYEVVNWFGVLAPRATPAEVTARLSQELIRILKLPDVQERFARDSIDASVISSEEFGAYMRSEMAKWAKVIQAVGARVE